ncbi:MAG: hypothetical protein U0M60_02230, partial [Clostridia bacterium]|nr:hypothetical protein [Clostridia bacterium]
MNKALLKSSTSETKVTPQIIRYRTVDDKVRMIDTSYTTDDENNQDTLIKAERNAAYANYYCKGRLGRDAIV